MPEVTLLEEADRQLTICNACRYCEGYCAMFQALVKRRVFPSRDIRYLGNLCHDCRACYYACQYAPPHEFAINIPKLLSQVRTESYERWTWPKFLGRVFPEHKKGILLCYSAAAIAMVVAALLIPSNVLFTIQVGPGAFYRIVPYKVMLIPGLILFFYGVAGWLQGGLRFWAEPATPSLVRRRGIRVLARAVWNALYLKYLDGGGLRGCPYPAESPSSSRRILHSFVFWGFLSDFASTITAAIYQDLLHWMPPYPHKSLPVILGILGGIALIIGAVGLFWIQWTESDRAPAEEKAYALDYAFLSILVLTPFTGLLTLLLRTTSALGTVLVIHLAFVAALFITMPYGKFVHFVYRTLALVRFEMERGAEN